jgi:penicillin-binding protein 1A
MGDMEWVDRRTAHDAANGPPPALVRTRSRAEGDMAWAYDAAALQARAMVGDASPDLVIEITVDPAAQQVAADVLRGTMRREGRARRAKQAALVALAPDGAIRAMIGGVNHDASPFNRVIQAKRQPGSAFKPLVWAAALEHGVRPLDARFDAPIRIGGWSPRNYGGGYSGLVTVQRALQLSLNTVSVRLAREAGLDDVAALARRFGLSNMPKHPGGSLALGAYEVTPLELAAAYQVLQSGGGQSRPYLISKITDARGQVLYFHPSSAAVPVYPVFQAAQMVQMMQGVITSGTGRDAAFGRPAAGKTGTSQNHRDAWFVGFTPDWLCAVWVGNDDNRPMARVTGGQIPAQIWRGFMSAAHRDLPVGDFAWFPAVMPSLAEPHHVPAQPEDNAFIRRNRIAEQRDEARIWLPGGGELADASSYEDDGSPWAGIPY